MNTTRNKTIEKLITERLEAEKPLEIRRAVLNENRDYIISHVDWASDEFIQSLESSDVISWDEHRNVKAQPIKMKPFKILEFLGSKNTTEAFDSFCKLLRKFGNTDASHRLQSALRAKQTIDNDIQQGAQKVVEQHFRCTTKSHPRQRELEQKVAEVLQTERGCWEAKVETLQGKLEKLQQELSEICSRLNQAVSKTRGTSAKIKKGQTGPLAQINAYTESFVQIIQDLKDQNHELVTESSSLRSQCEEMKWQVHMLEKVKHKQQEDIKKTKRELVDCKKNISDLTEELDRKDKEKSSQIAALVAALDEKTREIDALIEEKEALSKEMELIGQKVKLVEESQDRFREETEEKMSFLELKVQHLATFVDQPTTSRRSRHHNCTGRHASTSSGTSSSSASKRTPRTTPEDKKPPTLPPLRREGSKTSKKKSTKK